MQRGSVVHQGFVSAGGAMAATGFAPHFLRSLGPMYRSDLSGPAERIPLRDWLNVGRPTICAKPAKRRDQRASKGKSEANALFSSIWANSSSRTIRSHRSA